jgi:hypothetical protein
MTEEKTDEQQEQECLNLHEKIILLRGETDHEKTIFGAVISGLFSNILSMVTDEGKQFLIMQTFSRCQEIEERRKNANE